MKNYKARKKLALVMAVLLIVSLTGCANSQAGKTVKPSVSEDYYGAINYDLLQKKTIPATEGAWDYFYELDEKNYRLVGRRTRREYRLGQPVSIQVVKANLERKQLDFVLA